MNEAVSVLNQTNHERKVAGYGVHHKKGGSAVSKLGNNPMTWQEIQSKHGPIQTYTEGFTSYEDFKKMPPDLEAEYVNNLCAKYNIRHEDISTILFELSDLDLIARLKIKGVDKKLHIIKKSDVTDEARQKFKDDVNLWRDRTEKAKIVDLSEAQRKHDIIENAEFIDYEEFSAFTIDEKVLYLNSLIDKYGVSLAAIERELFKLPITNLRHKLDSAGVLKQIKRGNNGYNAIRANKDFCDALKNWRGESTLEEKSEALVEPIKEEPALAAAPETVARDILAAIIGEEPAKPSDVIAKILNVDKSEETAVEEMKKDELPESNISAIYIPSEKESEVVEAKLEEILAKTPVKVEMFEKSDDISAEESNRHNTVFSANYRSTGMDCDELDALKLMFKNKLVEVCITVRTI